MKNLGNLLIKHRGFLLGLCLGAWLIAVPSGLLVRKMLVEGSAICKVALFAGDVPAYCYPHEEWVVAWPLLIGFTIPTLLAIALQFVNAKKKK
ncbi:MAG: hypothetical protein WC813_03440 [Patescibacteria group bacterium]|jgi:hypothetical protein